MSAFSNTFLALAAIFLVSSSFDLYTKKVIPKNFDVGLTTVQLVSKNGYPIEIHEVVTEDGFILSLHRIPHGKSQKNKNGSIPVLLLLGILQTSAVFVNLGSDKALGYLLADRGFDVWLGNVRGTTWSRRHKSLNPDSNTNYWNFSIDEIGYHDLPTCIDYILVTTRRRKLHYIGYSQGTSIFFVMCSEKPQYAEKIELMSALAPSMYVGPAFSKWTWHIAYFVEKAIQKISNIFGNYEMSSVESVQAAFMAYVCDENSFFVNLCIFSLNLFRGHSSEQMNKTLLAVIFSNSPAGMSSKQFVHWMQIKRSEHFQKFDYGIDQNIEIYGQQQPPKYNVSRVTTPVGVYYSKGDHVVHLQGIEKSIKALPNVVKTHIVELDEFNHNDFVHGKDADKLLYKYVVDEHLKYTIET